MEKIKVVCKECGKIEYVYPCRAKKYVTCSFKCLGNFNSKRYGNKYEKKCEVCGKIFLVTKSKIKRRKCCSRECHNKTLHKKFIGVNNPNYKGRYLDSDGYLFLNDSKIKTHRKVVMNYLKIIHIPENFNIHHRDCNKLNNKLTNLVLLTRSDHLWLHKQFGNATLKAYMNNEIELEKLINWSDDKNRAKYLLNLDVTKQSVVVKQGELLETLFNEKDNQQPS